MDNFSEHGTEETLLLPAQVEDIFLQLCITSKIEPCDAGIVSALKTKYRMFQLERILDLVKILRKFINWILSLSYNEDQEHLERNE